MGLLPLLFCFSCSYYFPAAEIKDISLPDALHAYQMDTNDFIQDLHVTVEKMDYWINEHCYGGYDPYYSPMHMKENNVAQPQKEIPPRFFVPLVVSLKKDELWFGKTKLEEKDWETLEPDGGKYLLNELYDETSKTVELYRRFVDNCSYNYKVNHSHTILLAVDQEVSQFQLQRVIYTLANYGVMKFAFLVHDAEPDLSRENSQIAGIMEKMTEDQLSDCDWECMAELKVQITLMKQKSESFEWKTSADRQQTASFEDGLPKYLGEEHPPKARIDLYPKQTVRSLFQYHDALAGAEVFCTDWGFSTENEAAEGGSSGSISSPRRTIKLERNQKVSVHLLEPPANDRYVHRRGDGVICSGVMKMPAERRVEGTQSSHTLDLLKLLSDPHLNNLNIFKEKNK